MIEFFNGIPLTDWVDVAIELVGDIEGIPMPLAVKCSMSASRYLFQDIKAWKYTAPFDDYNKEANIATINNPRNATINLINEVSINNLIYKEKNELANKGFLEKSYKVMTNNHLLLYANDIPTKTNSLVKANLIPSLDSDGLPTALLEEYCDGLKYKAIERIYKSPLKSIFNPDVSRFYESEYTKMKLRYLRKPNVAKKEPPIASYGGL